MPEQKGKFVSDLNDLKLMLNGHSPVIVIESLEEIRILQFLTRFSPTLHFPLHKWTVTEGIRKLDIDFGEQENTTSPRTALERIKASAEPGYYVLLDFHPFLDDPIHVRLIREIAQQFDNIKKYLVLISYSVIIPPEIQYLSARFRVQVPDQARIKKLIKEEAMKWKESNGRNIRIQTTEPVLERLAGNLAGLTVTDARRLIRGAIAQDGAITTSDLPEVMKAKYELIAQDGVVSFEYDTAQFSDIAGLDKLKSWLSQRAAVFNNEDNPLDPPKGIMLLGVQGCGKSLAAKAVAGVFGVPLLRLDFGALYNKYHGETERNLRESLATADVMSPSVLWIDEIEKGLATSNSDDGLSRRVLGTLLTWMAERKSPVFIVATSNDIESLPPELVRKGRLDEIFFVDLPDHETRVEIFRIHLEARKLSAEQFDLPGLATISEGFSGAEIEQAIVSGLYAAQASDTELDDNHLVEELNTTRPLSVVMGEKISALRSWAADRTVPAD
ncbi:MAG: AAA family ATPase [bacterium]